MKLTSDFTNVIATPEEETRTYKITASTTNLERIEEFFLWLEHCSKVGHTAVARFSIDGDGAARIKFEGIAKTTKLPEVDEGGDPELNTGLD
jgi:hypothetical protein